MTRLLLISLLFIHTTIHAQVVVLNNSSGGGPIKSLPELTIASVHFNFGNHQIFDSIATNYWGITASNGDDVNFNTLHDQLKFFNTVFLECAAATVSKPDWIAFAKDLEQH